MPTIGLPASPVPSVSSVVGDLRHSWGCALPTRGGMCDCGAMHWSMWITYEQLAERLAEGWYEQDQQELSL